MEFNNLLVEKNEGICTIKINRPEALNSLNWETLYELEMVFDELKNDENIFVIILTGVGKAFVAGADINDMQDMDVNQAKSFSEYGAKIFRKIETLNKVVIAAVNGYALGGGCELTLACDIRIASEKARFGQPEVTLGITPGFSGTQRLPRLIGEGRAKEIIFTGMNIDAHDAYRIGLVNKVIEQEKLMEEACALANKIKSNSITAIKYAKEAINIGVETDIETGIAYETSIFGLCFAMEDQKEGMNAFVEKRKANFGMKKN